MNEKELPLPEPGINEHRKYFNHREEEREESNNEGAADSDGSAKERKVVKVPVDDYVSAANATTPTNEEWTECLHEAGYDSEQIAVILRGGTL
jgi:hypothetical protein